MRIVRVAARSLGKRAPAAIARQTELLAGQELSLLFIQRKLRRGSNHGAVSDVEIAKATGRAGFYVGGGAITAGCAACKVFCEAACRSGGGAITERSIRGARR